MKKLERIFLYSVLAVLIFYVFLVDNNVESQVAIQKEIKARRIAIVNDAGQAVVILYVDEDGYGRIEIADKGGNTIAAFMGADEDGGGIGILNKTGTPVAGMHVSKDGGGIDIANKDGISIANISANENGGAIGIFNKTGIPIAGMGAAKEGDGAIGIFNKTGTPIALMGVSEDDDGVIVVLNKQGDVIGSLP